ncbi:hypothetical protein TRICHSKD4_4570 [Roseibium sp. TrichSKD4]|uniref:hypothetical protein n=1 Tax=Roseibium sp. TrichSKD4 TaxID=744980 RepID=UPI0001E57622|nr:hypothetical protein [Roseibium sp. TrichSKD4]EFO30969.1 hypothetical protein TRICHSKD4_4570 [Roseibium sp. TrichSKD4]
MTQLDQKKSEHLTPTECPNDAFILTKISKSGRRYFFTGETSDTETAEGLRVLAKTGYLPGDAFVFQDEHSAMAIAVHLNTLGIGGACWLAFPLTEPL